VILLKKLENRTRVRSQAVLLFKERSKIRVKKAKNKKKLSKTTIISGIIGGIIGLFITPIVHGIKSIEGFISPPFYIVILIIVATYFLAVMLHEFGHGISFIRNGIEMRAIIFMNFILIKEDGRWKFKLTRNNTMGGIAVPEIEPIKDEEDFLLKQRGFAKALIAGPLASLISFIGLSIIGLLIIKVTSNIYIRSNIIIFLSSLGLITIALLGTSFLKNDMVVGDFPAYKIAKGDKYFVAMQLYNYGYFSSNPERGRKENIYLRQFILEELRERYKKQDKHWYTISMVDTILVEYLAGFLEELPEVIKDYIDLILKRSDLLSDIGTNQAKEILYFHLIRFLHRNEETRAKSFELYEEIKDTTKANTPKRKYLFKQIEQVLGIADNRDYLMDEKNIVITDMHCIYKHFSGFFMDEIKLNEISFEK